MIARDLETIRDLKNRAVRSNALEVAALLRDAEIALKAWLTDRKSQLEKELSDLEGLPSLEDNNNNSKAEGQWRKVRA